MKCAIRFASSKSVFLVAVLFVALLETQALHAAPEALMRASQYTYNAQFTDAEGLLNAHIASQPNDPLGYIVRGISTDWKQEVYGLNGSLDQKILADFENANKLAFAQWEKNENDISAMVNLGNSYMFLAKKWLDLKKKMRAGLILKKCKKHMEKAIGMDPDRFDAYLAIGLFNFHASNLPPGLGFLAAILGITGNESLGLSQLEKAAGNSHVFQWDSLFVLVYSLGHTKGRYAEAQPYLNKLSTRFPRNPAFMLLKGEYAWRGKRYAEAEEELKRFFAACKMNPTGKCSRDDNYLANYFLAAVYVEQKEYQAAKPHVQKIEELNEGRYKDRNSYMYLYKGLVLKAEKNKKAAAEAFQLALDAVGGDPKAKDLAKKEL